MTAQIHEILILDGEKTSMAFCPPNPSRHPRVYQPRPQETIRDEGDSILRSSACWRGYQGTWEIKDVRFYLIGLRGQFQLRESGPVLAEWFSGMLRVPKGEMLEYVHAGFCSVYEQELHIKIEKGAVLTTYVIDNRGKAQD